MNLRNITEVPNLEELKGTETLLINDGGVAKQMPISSIKSSTEPDCVYILNTEDLSPSEHGTLLQPVKTIDYQKLKEKFDKDILPTVLLKTTVPNEMDMKELITLIACKKVSEYQPVEALMGADLVTGATIQITASNEAFFQGGK